MMGRRISGWEDMTPAEIAHFTSGKGKWPFRHCNGRFCTATSVVDGTCGGQCRTGQKPAAKKAAPKVTPKTGASITKQPKQPTAAEKKKQKAAARRGRARADWDGYEESAYQAGESATRGNMERRGASSSIHGVYWPRGRRPWGAASKELVQYWDGGGMVPVTLTEYQAGQRKPTGRPWQDPDDRPKKKRRGKGRRGG